MVARYVPRLPLSAGDRTWQVGNGILTMPFLPLDAGQIILAGVSLLASPPKSVNFRAFWNGAPAMPAPGFDSVADGLNHLASALFDLAVPVLIAWALWYARRVLPPQIPPDISIPRPPDKPP